MAYLLECQVCNHRVEVTDPASGGIQCAECASLYSLRPVKVRAKLELRSLAERRTAHAPEAATPPAARGTAEPSPAVAAKFAGLTGVAVETVAEPVRVPSIPRPAVAAPEPAVPVRPPPRPPVPPRRVVPPTHSEYEPDEPSAILSATGPVAVLAAVAGILCAFIAPLGGWAIPLFALGLLAGVAGTMVDDGTDRRRALPAAAGITCCVLLVLGMVTDLSSSGRFGTGWSVDPRVVRVVPLTGDALDPDVDDDGWVDAGRAALQRGNVGVRVVSATVTPAGGTGAPGAAPTLVVRLQVRRVWGGEQVLKEDREPEAAAETARAMLTDDAGRACRPLPGGGREAAGPADSPAYVFEAPAAGYKFLRLELTPANTGDTGGFKFKIPNAVVSTEPIKGNRPNTGPGR